MAEENPHTWVCPSCARRVPLRAEACHCGMTRARAEEGGGCPPRHRRPARSRLPVSRREVLAAMPGDVKALVVAGAIVLAAGLGWLVFGPSRPSSTPALLGHVDQGPPPAPRPTPRPTPPFKLPWWK
jgi:hypothetical protein